MEVHVGSFGEWMDQAERWMETLCTCSSMIWIRIEKRKVITGRNFLCLT